MHIWIAFPFLPSHITVSIIYAASSIHIPNQIFFFYLMMNWLFDSWRSIIVHEFFIHIKYCFCITSNFSTAILSFSTKKKKKDAHKLFFIQTYWILFFHLNPILNIFKHNFNINSAKKKKNQSNDADVRIFFHFHSD